jgi:hypothetical protein
VKVIERREIMSATIRIAVLLSGLCAVTLRADIHSRGDGPTAVNPSKDCVVQVVSAEGHGTAWRSVSREACLARAHLAGDQPPLTIEMIMRHPRGPLPISGGTREHCSFIPYDMRLKGRGMSRKFWCYRTDPQGRYYSDEQAIVPGASGVSAAGFLVDARGQMLTDATGRSRRPQIIKVKYSTGGDRGREVYTEVAVHRFLWTLGFPTDDMFLATVVCAGCSRDPFNDIRTAAENRPVRGTNVFEQVSIERKAWAPLDSDRDEGWKWDDVYAMWSGNPEKRVQFEAYVLALNLVNFHNGLSKQNTLACDLRTWDPTTGQCGRPVIFLDDPGSSFGDGSQRGDYDAYRNHRVFLDAGACALRADLAGFGGPSEAARRFLVGRLDNLTPAGVRAIFESAGFDERTTGGSAAAWSTMFLQRIEEVRHASCR